MPKYELYLSGVDERITIEADEILRPHGPRGQLAGVVSTASTLVGALDGRFHRREITRKMALFLGDP